MLRELCPPLVHVHMKTREACTQLSSHIGCKAMPQLCVYVCTVQFCGLPAAAGSGAIPSAGPMARLHHCGEHLCMPTCLLFYILSLCVYVRVCVYVIVAQWPDFTTAVRARACLLVCSCVCVVCVAANASLHHCNEGRCMPACKHSCVWGGGRGVMVYRS